MTKLYKWSRKDIENVGKQGYKFIHCETEDEANEVKDNLKSRGRCAQAAFAINREGKVIYFVATKERNKH